MSLPAGIHATEHRATDAPSPLWSSGQCWLSQAPLPLQNQPTPEATPSRGEASQLRTQHDSDHRPVRAAAWHPLVRGNSDDIVD